IGYAMGNQGRILPYITGGFAYGEGNINGSGSAAGTPVAFSATNTYTGWTLGAGLEWAFWDRWSAKAEYLYIDFGNGPTVALTPMLNINAGRMIDHIGRVGVNYPF